MNAVRLVGTGLGLLCMAVVATATPALGRTTRGRVMVGGRPFPPGADVSGCTLTVSFADFALPASATVTVRLRPPSGTALLVVSSPADVGAVTNFDLAAGLPAVSERDRIHLDVEVSVAGTRGSERFSGSLWLRDCAAGESPDRADHSPTPGDPGDRGDDRDSEDEGTTTTSTLPAGPVAEVPTTTTIPVAAPGTPSATTTSVVTDAGGGVVSTTSTTVTTSPPSATAQPPAASPSPAASPPPATSPASAPRAKAPNPAPTTAVPQRVAGTSERAAPRPAPKRRKPVARKPVARKPVARKPVARRAHGPARRPSRYRAGPGSVTLPNRRLLTGVTSVAWVALRRPGTLVALGAPMLFLLVPGKRRRRREESGQ